jgi:RHS repeat-associated protein
VGAFPTSNTLLTKKFVYDVASADAVASGQRNLKGKISETNAYRLGSLCNRTFYSYDELGRVEWEVQSGLGTYAKKLYYWYDLQGNITKKGYVDLQSNYNMYTFYDYDQQGRLWKVWTGTDPNGSGKVKEAEYSYSFGDRVSQLKLGAAPAQTVDYTYNNRGWLTSINDPDNMGTDKFAEMLGYDTRDKVGLVFPYTAQNNGNISWLVYRMAGVSSAFWLPYYGNVNTDYIGRAFTYDSLNRLRQAPLGYQYGSYWFNNGNYFSENYTYSNDGNFITLSRTNNSGTLTDNLTYNYASGKNRLSSISNSAGAGSTYTYDDNGNMTSDSRSGISYIVYDMNNLPIDIYKTNGDHYICSYGVDGNRVRKSKIGGTETFYVNGPDGTTEAVQNGVSNSNYTYNIIGNENIGQAYRVPSGITRYYYLKDHLGSVRMVVKSDGTLDAYNDYYPYGMQMPTRNQTASADARYKFTGKERDAAETGLDWFDVRPYDSRTCIFRSPDPHGDLYPGLNSYAYCGNNPISFIDATGMDSSYYNSKNQYVYVNDAGEETVYESEAAARQAWGQQILANWGTEYIYDPNSIWGKFRDQFVEAVNSWATENQLMNILEGKENSVAGLLSYKMDYELARQGGPVLPAIGIVGAVESAGGSVVGNLLKGYTRHGLFQAIERDGVGVSTRAILDALRNPVSVEVAGNVKTIIGRDAVVVINQAGRVITTWARNGNGFRIK